jgi:exodeoxyribonuclease VII large subunit
MLEKPLVYTVSQINTIIKEALENNLPSFLTVTGQISSLKVHSSGHCYFSLKDENSVLPCAMWKTSFGRLKFVPENGMAVLASGFIDVYVPRGEYKLVVEQLIPAGVGALQLAFEQMKNKLQAEGLFDDEHKKALPTYPERIGIVTSETGAAVSDIVTSIHNRWPCVKLFLYPVQVQGEGAARQIAEALRDINRRNCELKLDLLIVGRGGGSTEDLWAFNEEIVARAVFDSAIPVISAVGHETDFTIADFVADARASTPTKAGVVAVPDMNEVLRQLDDFGARLQGNVISKLNLAGQLLETICASAVFRTPLLQIHNRTRQLDELSALVDAGMARFIADAKGRLEEFLLQVLRIEPNRLVAGHKVDLNNLYNRAVSAVKSVINESRLVLAARQNRLEVLEVRSVLKRGYSITTSSKTGKIIRSLRDVRISDLIVTELAEKNFIESKVTKKQNKDG